MASTTPVIERRTQADRSAETKQRLISAAIRALVDDGYAHTTIVDVCRRAGLTRGALQHHFPDPTDLYMGVLEQIFERLSRPDLTADDASLESTLREGWARVSHPDFKAVIEIWLAARNDPRFGERLRPAILELSRLFEPAHNPELAEHVGERPEQLAFYRLAFETMIGLALGRATSPDGGSVDHEEQVIGLLLELARQNEEKPALARHDHAEHDATQRPSIEPA